jgi:2-polyprenyl-3-methyl-5-hydroxy-6-metoxy-1,4-benzoquinol methylase
LVTTQTWNEIAEVTPATIGKQTTRGFETDPKRLGFVLSRYKFIAKVAGCQGSALEIGCGDGFGTTIIAQAFDRVTAVDIERSTLDNRSHNQLLDRKVEFRLHDILAAPMDEKFDVAFSLDVIEHIPEAIEDRFYRNMVASLKGKSTAIVGTPNLAAEAHQSEHSRRDHINLKSYDTLRADMLKYFDYVIMFGMNDEVVHTGFGPMCHYLLAVGMQPKA